MSGKHLEAYPHSGLRVCIGYGLYCTLINIQTDWAFGRHYIDQLYAAQRAELANSAIAEIVRVGGYTLLKAIQGPW